MCIHQFDENVANNFFRELQFHTQKSENAKFLRLKVLALHNLYKIDMWTVN